MHDPDAIRPHEAASLRARPTLAPEERPPDAVELTLSTITVPEGSEVELLQIAPGRFRVEARLPGERLGELVSTRPRWVIPAGRLPAWPGNLR